MSDDLETRIKQLERTMQTLETMTEHNKSEILALRNCQNVDGKILHKHVKHLDEPTRTEYEPFGFEGDL